MNRVSDRLEHLFSRQIDGECTPEERHLLERLISGEPQVRSLFDQYRELDRETGAALRRAMDRSPRIVPIRTLWARVGKGLAVTAAACLAALAWLHPIQTTTDPGPGRTQQAAAGGSWFVPLMPQGDAVEILPSAYNRPELRLRGTQRNWIVIPGDEPGTYLVIEVDHVRTHVIGIHQDF